MPNRSSSCSILNPFRRGTAVALICPLATLNGSARSCDCSAELCSCTGASNLNRAAAVYVGISAPHRRFAWPRNVHVGRKLTQADPTPRTENALPRAPRRMWGTRRTTRLRGPAAAALPRRRWLRQDVCPSGSGLQKWTRHQLGAPLRECARRKREKGNVAGHTLLCSGMARNPETGPHPLAAPSHPTRGPRTGGRGKRSHS